MNKELSKLTLRLMKAKQSGDQAKIEKAANVIKTYLKPFEEKLFAPSELTDEDSLPDLPDETEVAETIASDYYKVIKFVLKRMHLRKFEEIRFDHKQNDLIDVSIVYKGKEYLLDFDADVHHDDEDETECLMEIDALSASDPSLDWNSVIGMLRAMDWSKYLQV